MNIKFGDLGVNDLFRLYQDGPAIKKTDYASWFEQEDPSIALLHGYQPEECLMFVETNGVVTEGIEKGTLVIIKSETPVFVV